MFDIYRLCGGVWARENSYSSRGGAEAHERLLVRIALACGCPSHLMPQFKIEPQ